MQIKGFGCDGTSVNIAGKAFLTMNYDILVPSSFFIWLYRI